MGQAEGQEPDDDDDGRRRTAAVGEERRQEGEYPRLCEVEQETRRTGKSVSGGGAVAARAPASLASLASPSDGARVMKFRSRM